MNKYLKEAEKYKITKILFDVFKDRSVSFIKKEITEFWPVFKKIKSIKKKNNKILFIDVGAGAGIFDLFLSLYFKDNIKIIMIDKNKKINYEKRFKDIKNVEWYQIDIKKFNWREILQKYKNEGYIIIVNAIHLCRDALTELIKIVNKNKDFIDYFFAMPCCIGKIKNIKLIKENGKEMNKYDVWSLYNFFLIDAKIKTIRRDKNVLSKRNYLISAKF